MRLLRRGTAGLAAAAAVLGLAVLCLTRTQADDKSGGDDRADLNTMLYKSLREAINHGADLYNLNRDYSGCYHVYEGALLTARPMLGHKPDLQKAIDDALSGARANPS